MISARFSAFKNAPEKIFSEGYTKLTRYFSEFGFDLKASDPHLFFILSGGSELFAIEQMSEGNFYLLLASGENNSWAAATEIKAWMDEHRIDGMLFDLENYNDLAKIKNMFTLIEALAGLQGKSIGLIGEPSEWLVASDVDLKALKARFGLSIQKIKWTDVPDYKIFEPDLRFADKYPFHNKQSVGDASKVKQALQFIIHKNKFDAITVECFSLVQEKGVTACLALSDFNDQGTAAGCEGDLTSISGMMFLKAVTGIIPWMANLVKISNDRVRFAHCTAPVNLLEQYRVDTHFETGKGTAVAGKFSGEIITLFRWNRLLTRAFVAKGKITEKIQSPDQACRTMIEACLDPEKTSHLKNNPLGNHHLILPGDHTAQIQLACRLKGILAE